MNRLVLSSLRVRSLLLVLLAVIPALGVMLFSATWERRSAKNEARAEAVRLVAPASGDLAQSVKGVRQLLAAMAYAHQLHAGSKEACGALLAQIRDLNPRYANLASVDPRGNVLCSAVPLKHPVNISDFTWFQIMIRTRGFVIGRYQVRRVTEKPSLHFGYPILDDAGLLTGGVFASLDLAWLNEQATRTKLPEEFVFTILDDREGTILARNVNPARWMGRHLPDAPVVKAILSTGEGLAEIQGVDGVARLYAFKPLFRGTDPVRYVTVGIPRDALYAKANRSLTRNLTGLGLVALLALAAAWFGSDLAILRPVKALLRAANRLGKGDLSARAGVGHGAGEIGQLTRTFDGMAESIEQNAMMRNQAEVLLRESEERYRKLFETSPDAIAVFDLNQNVIMVNEQSVRLFGYESAEEMIGVNLYEFIAPEDRPLVEETARNTMESEAVNRREVTNLKKDGTRFPVEVSTALILDAEGKPLGHIAIARDISERKRAEGALRESEVLARRRLAELDQIYTNSPVGLALVDRELRFVRINERLAAINGRSVSDHIGHTVREVLPEFADRLEPLLRGVIKSKQPVIDVETHGSTPAQPDVRREWLTSYYPLLAPDGTVQGVNAVIQEITDHKRREEEIRHLNAELEHRVAQRTAELENAVKELEAFSYSVSHDLRAPVRHIEGFSKAVLEDYADKLDLEGKRDLERVRAAALRMGEIIDGLFNLSLATRSALHLQEVNLSEMATAIAAELRETQPERTVEFSIAPVPQALGDVRLLRLVLENLLGNAWKYTSKQTRARIEFGAFDREERTVYYVKDDGVGFDMAHAMKLFRAFERLHSPGEFKGSGIGLATVLRIIRRHGGHIWAEGRREQGATFYFTLPGREIADPP